MEASEKSFSFLQDGHFKETIEKHGLQIGQVQALAISAVRAKARAYCPHSNFRVGAALLTKTILPITSIMEAPSDNCMPLSSSTQYPFASESTQSLQPNQIIIGANIENCSYPVGTCAERSAFATAVSLGHLPIKTSPSALGSSTREGQGLLAVAVSTDTDEPCSPCGMCRQFMREFLPQETPIFMFAREGNWTVKTMGELLPMSFGASDLAAGQNRS